MTDSLLSRLLSLTEPSREVEVAIWEQLNGERLTNDFARAHVPRYTESLDAVEPLAAEFYYLFVKGKTRPDEPLYGVQILRPDGSASDVIAEAEHDLPSVALLIAILKAKEESKP